MCPAVSSAGDTRPLPEGILGKALTPVAAGGERPRLSLGTGALGDSQRLEFPCDAEYSVDQGFSFSVLLTFRARDSLLGVVLQNI